MTDLGGGPALEGDMTVLATNGLLHEAILSLVEGVPRSRDLHALDDGVQGQGADADFRYSFTVEVRELFSVKRLSRSLRCA